MKHERPDHTLQPTALVHEVYLRLVDAERVKWRGRSEFLSLAAQQIRKVLVDHARRHKTAKRGGGVRRIEFEGEFHGAASGDIDMAALDDALIELAQRSDRQARVVEMRFFAGMSVEQVAELLGASARTIKGDWRAARAWLAGQMRE